ncbi:One of three possible beta-subunits of the Snf1 kinase complex [Komagataella phaffii GS115]|uniref:One of three possible beta-subunits of the Snf1 kinase complex n=1 Tax=Komagataella phaffii (strain GS115 / ATCC 20864) TaxID=644223 RepID=C4QYM8_KOMPG|nr:One of three possible beta-subunits of the Snf1 kinase complex [Komagataella phaffii GS115]AOA61465.1 GQ67_01651T0 [Komagataella phaffii]AOA66476.1 GQ68_01667T0 [Komagataella phaffii GS115]CAY68352.1 One of three possible beta-subunits of the Snf1 kinase complex [Komagataella phaffii GS115]
MADCVYSLGILGSIFHPKAIESTFHICTGLLCSFQDKLTTASHRKMSGEKKDVLMTDVNELTQSASVMNIDDDGTTASPSSYGDTSKPERRKSTLIFTDDVESPVKMDSGDNENEYGLTNATNENVFTDSSVSPQDSEDANRQQQQLQPQEGKTSSQHHHHHHHHHHHSNQDTSSSISPEDPQLVAIELRWSQGGQKVFVTGSFTGWRKMIALHGPAKDGSFSLKLKLPFGTHRFRFIVDNELRFSDFLPTATDQAGNFVNYLEITPDQFSEKNRSQKSLRTLDSKLGLTQDDDDMGNGYTRYHDEQEQPQTAKKEYITGIPAIFTDPKVMEQYYLTLDNQQGNHNQQQWLIPPQLPPHLENVILNNFSNDKENNSGSLPIPNHVVLNHLATTSIKHNTLAVASVVRYQRKYATQILYAPLQ